MNCKRAGELIAEFLANELDEPLRQELEPHLAECGQCRQEVAALAETWEALGSLPPEKPSADLRSRFDAMLAGYQHGMERGENVPPRRWRMPSFDSLFGWLPNQPAFQLALLAVVLGVGLAGGYLFRRGSQDNTELARLRDEVHTMRQLVTLSMLQQQSASGRLEGVSWSHRVRNPDNTVLAALLDTLHSDPNVDVRLASIDALSRFSDQAVVRTGLVEALPRQNSPLVQIALIDLLVELRERKAVETLKTILKDEQLNKTVRQRVEWGLSQLS